MPESDVSAAMHRITTMPLYNEEVNIVDTRRASSPSPSLSYSDSGSSVSLSSDSITSKSWTPAGVYVPLHRRERSGSDTSATSVNTNTNTTSNKRANSTSSRPGIQVYSRAELLALAPSSLIHASLHPVVTPALIVKHPRILRARGDGIARALDMARNSNGPTLASSYADMNWAPNLRLNASASVHHTNAMSAGLRDVMTRSARPVYFASSEAATKSHGRVEQGFRLKTPMQAQSSVPSLSSSTSPLGETRLDNIINIDSVHGSPRRRRRRRAAFQRNLTHQHQQLAVHPHVLPHVSMQSEREDAKLESGSTVHSVMTTTSVPSAAGAETRQRGTAPQASVMTTTSVPSAAGAETRQRGTAPQAQTRAQTQMNTSTNKLQATIPASIPRTTRSRHNKRQLDDVTVLSSWRAPPTAVAA